MSPLDLDAIESRAKRCASDVPLPECECEKRGHAPCCYDCYLAYRAAVGPTFEECGRGDVLALVALARAAEMLTAQRDAALADAARARDAYASDLAGLRAEVRRADDERAAWRERVEAAERERDAALTRERDAARAALRDASRCDECGAWATRYHHASSSYCCDSCGVGEGWADDTHAVALRAARVP